MVKEVKKMVPLTDEEFRKACLQKDIADMNAKAARFNLEQGKKAVDLRLAQRQAEAQLEQTEEEFTRAKMNLKFYTKLVRDKAREEVTYVEEDEE